MGVTDVLGSVPVCVAGRRQITNLFWSSQALHVHCPGGVFCRRLHGHSSCLSLPSTAQFLNPGYNTYILSQIFQHVLYHSVFLWVTCSHDMLVTQLQSCVRGIHSDDHYMAVLPVILGPFPSGMLKNLEDVDSELFPSLISLSCFTCDCPSKP